MRVAARIWGFAGTSSVQGGGINEVEHFTLLRVVGKQRSVVLERTPTIFSAAVYPELSPLQRLTLARLHLSNNAAPYCITESLNARVSYITSSQIFGA